MKNRFLKLALLGLWVAFLAVALLGGCSFRMGGDCAALEEDVAVQICLKAPSFVKKALG